MRIVLFVLAMAVAGGVSAQQPRRDTRHFHIWSGSTLSCRDPNALLALTEKNARQAWGDINYMRIANDGNCAEVGNSLPFMICYTTPNVSFMAQIRDGVAGRCYFMPTVALSDDEGRPIPIGISN